LTEEIDELKLKLLRRRLLNGEEMDASESGEKKTVISSENSLKGELHLNTLKVSLAHCKQIHKPLFYLPLFNI
jgi:hypothetical protein